MDLKKETKFVLEELKKVCVNLDYVSVYDTCAYSLQELVYNLYKKLNEVIKVMKELEVNVDDKLLEFQKLLEFILNQGLSDEVVKQLKVLIKNGTISNLINHEMFGEFNNQISNLIATKADKTTTSALQGQINNLVINGSGNSNPEVVQARTNFLGIVFATLAERLLFIENSLNGTSFPINYSEWEQGGINTNNGVDTPSTEYLRTRGYLNFKGLDKINFNLNNCRIFLIEYSREGKNFIRTTEKNSNFVLTNLENYFRIVVAPPTTINVSDVSKYFNMVGSYSFEELKILNNLTTPLNSLINTCNNYLGDISYMGRLKWELGGIIGSTGVDITNDYALRSDFYTFDTPVIAKSLKDIYCVEYQQDGTYIKRIDPSGDKITINNLNNKYRFVVSNGYGNPITDIDNFLKFVDIKSIPKFNQKVLEVVSNGGVSSPLNGKIFNCLGDSITSTDYTTPTWWQQIATKTGAKFNNYGVSGTCVGYNEDRETRFGKCFANRYNEMTDNVDGVIVMGGTNDYEIKLGTYQDTTNKSFYGALDVLIKGLLERYKGKTIIFMTPIQQALDYKKNVLDPLSLIKNGSDSPVSLQLRAEAIKVKCRQYGIPCIDLYTSSGINGVDENNIYYRGGDQTHPSYVGQNVIANCLINVLEDKFKIKE